MDIRLRKDYRRLAETEKTIAYKREGTTTLNNGAMLGNFFSLAAALGKQRAHSSPSPIFFDEVFFFTKSAEDKKNSSPAGEFPAGEELEQNFVGHAQSPRRRDAVGGADTYSENESSLAGESAGRGRRGEEKLSPDWAGRSRAGTPAPSTSKPARITSTGPRASPAPGINPVGRSLTAKICNSMPL